MSGAKSSFWRSWTKPNKNATKNKKEKCWCEQPNPDQRSRIRNKRSSKQRYGSLWVGCPLLQAHQIIGRFVRIFQAKEMQRAEMEELRQRDANLTALQAIGPRKKPKLEVDGSSAANVCIVLCQFNAKFMFPLYVYFFVLILCVQSTGSALGTSNSTVPLRPRIKRVNLRDMIFFLEQERETCRSTMLYKSYLKWCIDTLSEYRTKQQQIGDTPIEYTIQSHSRITLSSIHQSVHTSSFYIYTNQRIFCKYVLSCVW